MSAEGQKATSADDQARSALPLPAQPVDATQALNLSAGVSNCKVSRGRSFEMTTLFGHALPLGRISGGDASNASALTAASSSAIRRSIKSRSKSVRLVCSNDRYRLMF